MKNLLLICVILLACATQLFGGIEYYSERKEGASIANAFPFELFDDKHFEMTANPLWGIDFTNASVNNYVRVGINPKLPINTHIQGTVELDIEYETWIGGSFQMQTITQLFQVDFDGSAANGGYAIAEDQLSFRFTGAHWIKVSLGSVSGLNLTDLFVESGIEVERYYSFQDPNIAGLSDLFKGPSNQEIEFRWESNVGAESYELEWVHVNEYTMYSGSFLPPSDLKYNFYLNSTRIETSNNHYTIPNVFDYGYIVYRIRPIGVDGITKERIEGLWSEVESGTIAGFDPNNTIHITTNYDVGMNWSHQVAYAEEGKRFEGISFADGLGRSRQSVARNSDNEQVIVSNVYFDEIGRPVVSDLPSPVEDDYMRHYKNFNRPASPGTGSDPESYMYLFFDIPSTNICDPIAAGFSTTDEGAGKYYSPNNPNQDGENAHIPDAESFPFTRVKYRDDLTGRVSKVSAAGATLASGMGRETTILYSDVSQEELDILFGIDAGLDQHYQKMITIDPNKQSYVQITDMAGRVVASYMEGSSPANLTQLASNSGATVVPETILEYPNPNPNNIEPQIVSNNPPMAIFTTPIVVTEDDNYLFTYDITPEQYQSACNPANICFDCVYDLELSVVGPCDELFTQTVSINGTTLDDACNGGVFPQLSLNAPLQVGKEYTLYKKITVNQDAIETYWCYYFNDNSCISTVQDEFELLYPNEPFTECTTGYDFSTPNSNPCEPYKQIMLFDMKPGGQYATYTENGSGSYTFNSQFSVFHPNNLLGLNTAWYNLPFLNENGQNDPNFSSTLLSPDEKLTYFIANYRSEWAEVLLPYHPEYCYLVYCESNGSSHAYDNTMLNTSTFTGAFGQGFLLPTNATLTPVMTSMHTGPSSSFYQAPTQLDPFFIANGTYSASMNTAITDYISILNPINNSYVSISMWEYAIYLANECQGQTGNVHNCIGDGILDCKEDMVWTNFRNLYLEKKRELFFQAMDAHASTQCTLSTCIAANPPCTLVPQNELATYTPIWSFQNVFQNFSSGTPTDMLDFFGLTQNPSTGDITSIPGQGPGQSCATLCDIYADEWLVDIAGCLPVGYDVTQLKADFVSLCLTGCSSNNVGAYTTAPPTVTSGFTSVADILLHHFPSVYPSPICTELLISNAGPYELPVSMINQYDKLDTCGCNFLYDAQNAYQLALSSNSVPAGITDLEQWISATEGIDFVDVDGLLCSCDKYYNTITDEYVLPASTGWYLPAPDNTTIPIEISCRGDIGCIDCNELSTLEISLNALFSNPLDKSHPNYQAIYTNYMNNETGFNFEYQTYLKFQNQCSGTPENPYCELNPLMIQWKDMMNVLILRDQFKDGVSNYDLNLNNIVYVQSQLGIETLSENYSSSISGSTLTTTYSGQNGTCNFVFQIPATETFGFEDITFLTAIYADEPTNCSVNSFEIEVEYYDCGVKTIGYINCTTTCLELMQCSCGGASLCPDSEDKEFIPCYQPRLDEMFVLANDAYEQNIADQKIIFTDEYNAKCAEAFETEKIVFISKQNFYQLTLFYYDQAGNLKKTVAPKGTDQLTLGTSVSSARSSVSSIYDPVATALPVPNHDFETTYEYNSYNQLVSTSNPDQIGETKYYYDRFGRIVASQNPVQANSNQYAYTHYDKYGRPIEVGILGTQSLFPEADAKDPDCMNLLRNWHLGGSRTELTLTYYDKPFYLTDQSKFASGAQENLRLRVASVYYYDVMVPGNQGLAFYETATHFSYDPHGNVIEQLQDVRQLQVVDQNIKSTQYEFELISGNVEKVHYQKDKIDQITHSYKYDGLNRLSEVFTTTDQTHLTRQAHYRYYDYGPLARVEMGKNKVQGMDFAYTINGWLKGMNSSFLDSDQDIGKDGGINGYLTSNNQLHNLFAKDVLAYTLGYFDDDYQPIKTSSMMEGHVYPSPATLTFNTASPGLYNGNIRNYISSIQGLNTTGVSYEYDQLNRLTQAQYHYNDVGLSTNADGFYQTPEYFNSYSYDENGNIESLLRKGAVGNLDMDDFVFNYPNNPLTPNKPWNRLSHVNDNSSYTTNYSDDIDNMQVNNFAYDELGQLISDVSENIQNIEWRKGDKKMKKMTRNGNGGESQLEFVYNPFGQRVLKIDKPTASSGAPLGQDQWTYTYYSYDANGQVMAVYDINLGNQTKLVTLSEQHLYGSSRLGMIKPEITLYDDENIVPLVIFTPEIMKSNELGRTYYEISNYLGNVNAIITDRRNLANPGPGASVWEAVLVKNVDYYPFGMIMPGRSNSYGAVDDYRYAYNGMELDNGVSGNGNSYTTEFRQYDPRLGRWKSLDPLMFMFPWQSPYCAFDDNPVLYVDPYGLAATNDNEPVEPAEGGGDFTINTDHRDPNGRTWDVDQQTPLTEFEEKLPREAKVGDFYHIKHRPSDPSGYRDGDITQINYEYEEYGHWKKTTHMFGATFSGSSPVAGTADGDASLLEYMGEGEEIISFGGGQGGTCTTCGSTRGSGVSTFQNTVPAADLMGAEPTKNSPTPERVLEEQIVSKVISLEATMVETAANASAKELAKKGANYASNTLKTVSKAAGVVGGVVGVFENGVSVYNDIQTGEIDAGTYQDGTQALLYTGGTAMLFSPLAPIGAIVLTGTAVWDFVQMVGESW